MNKIYFWLLKWRIKRIECRLRKIEWHKINSMDYKIGRFMRTGELF